ncbi:MAG TPA: T9SS type A sorting domain-containing protein [Saprospiraceae bacterium]|nr:T9SS type A sorting domain-containing protein [Saprospiraceae bacterium]
MKNWLLIGLCFTLVQALAQEKVSSIVTDNSNSLKYITTHNEQTYLIEIYPGDDVLVYEWVGQETGKVISVRNIPGIGLFKNIHIGERALLYESNGKKYFYDFITDSPPKEISNPNVNLATGILPLPGEGSEILGGGQPYHLFTSLSPTLIPLPLNYNFVQTYQQYLIVYKSAGNAMGNNYYCYNALTGEFTLLIEGTTRKHNVCFFNEQIWFLDKKGDVMVMNLMTKNILPSGMSTDLKNASNIVFTDGRTLLVCQTNPEKTYLEAFDFINGTRLWDNTINLEGGVEKNQVSLYQNFILLRTLRDKIITLDISNQFFIHTFEISASFSQTGIPVIGPYLVVPNQNEFTFFNMQTQKIHKQNVGFGLNQLTGLEGTDHNFEITFSCHFIDKKLPTLFSFKNDSLFVKNIQPYNTGCSIDAQIKASDEHLFLIDHSLFSITDHEQQITNTSFRQGENRYLNFSKNKHYYLKHAEPYSYLLTHDGVKEDTLFTSAGAPKKYEFITQVADQYFVFADESLYNLDPADKTLTLLKTSIRYVYEEGDLLYFKLGNHLGLLDEQGNIHEYDVMVNSTLPFEFISHNGLQIFGSNFSEITVLKNGKIRQTIQDVFIITRLHYAKNRFIIAYISTPDFEERWFSVDTLGELTQFVDPGTNYFTTHQWQCKDFLILQSNDQTNYVFDYDKNRISPLTGEIEGKNCLYLYQDGIDTLAYVLHDKVLYTYQLSQSFSSQTLLHSLPFDYSVNRLKVYEIPNHLVMMGLSEMIVFDSKGRASILPLNTYLLENNPLVEWQNNYYCIASDSFEVRQVYKIDFEHLTTSTTALTENKEVFIYPNPCIAYFTIEGTNEIKNLWVIDKQGRMRELRHENGTVDVTMLPAGLYFLKIESNVGKKVTKKLLKL